METVRKEWGRQKEGMRADSIDRVSGENQHRMRTDSEEDVKTVYEILKKKSRETLKTG